MDLRAFCADERKRATNKEGGTAKQNTNRKGRMMRFINVKIHVECNNLREE